ncbi:helix-hairpin-helix domain-containing protein [Halobellus sp. H-GB7]|uniref:helix-hairpin-helix domain-containing protein n=1 Tax=Halobellus sp. H-GB7 TaxID=3069756 RepID=UPI0027AF83FF|nr:helix-hairpin-helix domain-containing protein [Halobellus sp. H-GB7]MDQ2056192.1 helix-hairpin-helix domain-containing protein [Halobellus sp. H-GB7]
MTDAESDPAEQEIEGISGLGPTYNDRLAAAGIDTLGSLADSDPTDIAAAANVTENKAQDWIDRANELVREQRSTT